MTSASSRLRYYNLFGARRIDGWFSRVDSEMFAALLLFQRQEGLHGANAEIGVHHGKSFIPMCLTLAEDERAICLDVFDDQHLNLDHSGNGSLAALHRNLARHSIDLDKVDIVKGSSLGFPPEGILSRVGPVRFISIDGGHWPEIVVNDLRLAQACAAPGQIIALDDFLNVDWAGVTVGFFDWYLREGNDYAPFALSHGKLYLCPKYYRDSYQACLRRRPLLRYNTKKTADLLGYDVPVISGPNGGLRGRIGAYLRKYSPNQYAVARARFTGSQPLA